MTLPGSATSLTIRGRILSLQNETKIMGVLNVTPDSFSDGGQFIDPAKAEERALKMEAEGAHLIDIGGESSRPGSKAISWKEELRRVLPILKRLKHQLTIPISLDTYKVEVARAALDHGVDIINDIYGLRSNKALAKCIAKSGGGVILMHMQGNPSTMQRKPAYKDLMKEIKLFLKGSVELAEEAGIERSHIAIDPGFGFGKTMDQNFELLSRLDEFVAMGHPLVVGLSRKSFLGNHLGVPATERLSASLAAAAVALQKGAHVLRVHDVLPHRQLAQIIDRISKTQ